MYSITDMSIVSPFFDNWGDGLVTLIWSCLQGCAGQAWADHADTPQAMRIDNSGVIFHAGKAASALLEEINPGAILVPQAEEWNQEIERYFGEKASQFTRYATKKDTATFDRAHLAALAAALPTGYSLEPIDEKRYAQLKSETWSADLVSNFADYAAFSAHGVGVVAVFDDKPATGASTFCYYRDGIEIEIDTRRDARRQGLARACGAALILACLERGLYPSWDAHTTISLGLAEQLGYQFSHGYIAYELKESEEN